MWKEKLRPSPTCPYPLAKIPVEITSTANSLSAAGRSTMTVIIRPYLSSTVGCARHGQIGCVSVPYNVSFTFGDRRLFVAVTTNGQGTSSSELSGCSRSFADIGRWMLVESTRDHPAHHRA